MICEPKRFTEDESIFNIKIPHNIFRFQEFNVITLLNELVIFLFILCRIHWEQSFVHFCKQELLYWHLNITNQRVCYWLLPFFMLSLLSLLPSNFSHLLNFSRVVMNCQIFDYLFDHCNESNERLRKKLWRLFHRFILEEEWVNVLWYFLPKSVVLWW